MLVLKLYSEDKTQGLPALFLQVTAIVRDVVWSGLMQRCFCCTKVTDIEPDAKVRAAMNEINAAQRMREAAIQKAEAEKVMVVKRAEASAEAK